MKGKDIRRELWKTPVFIGREEWEESEPEGEWGGMSRETEKVTRIIMSQKLSREENISRKREWFEALR